MKILLIEPTRCFENGKPIKLKQLFSPALTLPRLASLLPPDIDVSIISEPIEDINFDEEVDLVGITSYTINVHRAYHIADEFRKRKIPVVMGGIHVSMEPEEALEHADTVIAGEAEETWPQFIKEFRNGIRRKMYKAQERPSLINLPTPRFSLLNQKRYLGYRNKGVSRFFLKPLIPIETARGCPYSCAFCTVTKFFGGKYRPRPITNVVNEIKALGARNCFFVDDNIFSNPRRAKKLFKALIPLKIAWRGQATIGAAEDKELIQLARKSGCSSLGIGLESLSCKSLESVGKTMNKVEHYEKYLRAYREEGISTIASMMFGFDEEEPTVFKEAYDFMIKNRIYLAHWQAIRPHPGTLFYQRLKDQGRLKGEKWWLSPSGKFYCLRYTGTKMEDEVFSKNFYHYYTRFYSLKNIVRRILFPPQEECIFKFLVNLALRKRLLSNTTIYEH